MKNGLDEQYIDLLTDILENGVEKNTRNGKVLSVFGRTIRYKFKDGKFPLLTTKKMAWKSIVTELLWFLRGDINIKYLVDNECHIWDGDAYKNYEKNNSKIEYIGSKCSLCGNISNHDTDYLNEYDTNCIHCGKEDKWEHQYKDLPSLTQEEFINKIKTDDEFAKKWGELGSIYGFQWRKWGGEIDQISDLIKQLKENPDSRRLLVSAWSVHDLPKMVLPPCHYGFQVYTRELSEGERSILYSKKMEGYVDTDDVKTTEHYDRMNIPKRAISLGWNQRSVDTFLGLPFNIASYGLLLEILAKIVNMVPDELIGNLGDVHLYSNHIEQAKEQITRTPYELPKIVHMKTDAFWNGFDISQFGHLDPTDFKVDNYQSHPSIKAPLSN